jgi:hypothetical protein
MVAPSAIEQEPLAPTIKMTRGSSAREFTIKDVEYNVGTSQVTDYKFHLVGDSEARDVLASCLIDLEGLELAKAYRLATIRGSLVMRAF